MHKLLSLQVLCAFCRSDLDTGGEVFYPPYTRLGDAFYLKGGTALCPECLDQLGFFNSQFPPKDPLLPREMTQVISPLSYKNYAKELIIRFKYGGERDLADCFGKLMTYQLMAHQETESRVFSKVKSLFMGLPYDTIVPVPLSRDRLIERGYNQADLLARVIARETGIPQHNLVERRVHTDPLKEQSPQERAQSLAGAFFMSPGYESLEEYREISRILIVDDIYTTGATTKEMARILGLAGCKTVSVLTIARQSGKKEG